MSPSAVTENAQGARKAGLGESVGLATASVGARTTAVPPGVLMEGRAVPLMIPADEAGYWSTTWQEDERAALAEWEAGNFARFSTDDPLAIVRWLLDGKDD